MQTTEIRLVKMDHSRASDEETHGLGGGGGGGTVRHRLDTTNVWVI